MIVSFKNVDIKQDDNPVLNHIDFSVDEGEFVYIIGKVGSGKTTLLKAIYGELPAKGDEAVVADFNLLKLKRKYIPELRKKLGIIFQDFQLLSEKTVADNLLFVLKATGWKDKKKRQERVKEILEVVGMDDKADKYPFELSGGEQQRVAIARSLLNSPKLILADEPTGNLDQESGRKIINLLRGIRDNGTSVVVVTHNLSLLDEFPGVVYTCSDGHLELKTERLQGESNGAEADMSSGSGDEETSGLGQADN